MRRKTRAINGDQQAGEALASRFACPLHSVCERLGVTVREHEVCTWLMRGKTNAEIAAILGISPRTAEKHVHQLLKKLGVENRTTAAIELWHRLQHSDG